VLCQLGLFGVLLLNFPQLEIDAWLLAFFTARGKCALARQFHLSLLCAISDEYFLLTKILGSYMVLI
jgi:hypothetical protein